MRSSKACCVPARLPRADSFAGCRDQPYPADWWRREVRGDPHAGSLDTWHGCDSPGTDEYVAIGAARQAAWVLSGEAEPPTWQLTIEGVETGEPTEAVYEAYAKARG